MKPVKIAVYLLTFAVVLCHLVGCGGDPAASEQRADQQMNSGQVDRAVSSYESAANQLRRTGANPDDAARIEEKLAQARARLAVQARSEVAALLEQARADALARRWGPMMAKVEKARNAVAKTHDAELTGLVSQVYDSQLLRLARTARAYKAMCRSASWANWGHWLGGDDWFVLYSELSSENLGFNLEDAAAKTSDHQLVQQAAELSNAWRAYNRAKEVSRMRDRNRGSDEGWLGALVDVGVGINEVASGVKFDKKRQDFENRLEALLSQARFPDVAVRPASQPAAPAAPASTAAAAPAPQAPRTTPVVASPAPAGAGTVVGTGGREVVPDRPLDDEDQLRRTGR